MTGATTSRTAASPFAVIGISRSFTQSSGLVITPDAEIGYRYDSTSNGGAIVLTATDGTALAGNQYSLAHSSALVGASLTAHNRNFSAFAKYNATLSDRYSDQHIEAGFRLAF